MSEAQKVDFCVGRHGRLVYQWHNERHGAWREGLRGLGLHTLPAPAGPITITPNLLIVLDLDLNVI